MTDILNRIDIRKCYETDEIWSHALNLSKNNLLNIPTNILNKINILQDQEFITNISDNDAVVIAKLGTDIILSSSSLLSPVNSKLYMADRWELLGDNMELNNESCLLIF